MNKLQKYDKYIYRDKIDLNLIFSIKFDQDQISFYFKYRMQY